MKWYAFCLVDYNIWYAFSLAYAGNKEVLIQYHLRSDISILDPPEGLVYRHLGTMEHNICDVLSQRMKGRKMSWSISGAENIAKILS